MTRIARGNTWPVAGAPKRWLLLGLGLGLALFYWAGVAPVAFIGCAVFGVLAFLRPDLALLFVPFTVPLYLIPASLTGLRADVFRIPLHETALLLTVGATAARWLLDKLRRRASPTFAVRTAVRQYAPYLLFLLAGVLGVLLAAERARAVREFRWLILEPLLFYALLLYFARRSLAAGEESNHAFGLNKPLVRILTAFVLGGAVAGLIGVLQFVGLDVVPLLGRKECFAPDGGPCANIVTDGGVRRVLSVYGHPNNLGLYLGRVWPVAAAFVLVGWRERTTWRVWWFGVAAALCLAGIVVSFSRGAWLGVLAAAAVLGLGLMRGNSRWAGRRFASLGWLIALGASLVVLAGLALSVRGDVTAGSTPVRLLLWQEAVGYIVRHPFGLGLDQFGFYHAPSSGMSLINPALIGTSEEFAAHPHNLVLDIWLELGPLGLLAFGWLLMRFFRTTWNASSSWIALGAGAAMVAALVHGLVDNFYFVPDLAFAFWLLVGVAVVVQWNRTSSSPDTLQKGASS